MFVFWIYDMFEAMRVALTVLPDRTTRQIIKTTFGGDYLPLSVYETKGYTKEQLNHLEKNAPKRFDPSINDWITST